MIQIDLSQGAIALVDEADAALVGGLRWHASEMSHTTYAVGRDQNGRTVYMHRLIMGAEPGQEVDHANHDGLDNRRSNLRLVSRAQNAWNRAGQRGKTSPFKGVSWSKRERCWVANMNPRDSKHLFLGYFDDEVEAALAYDQAARAAYGEFAFLNFPEVSRGPAPRARRSHRWHRSPGPRRRELAALNR